VLLLIALSLQLGRRWRIGEIFYRLGWRSLALTVAILAVFFVVQLRPYLSLFGTLPPQPMTETFVYSARPWSVLLEPSVHSVWYRPALMNYGFWERTAFPGLPLLLLAAAGVVAWRRGRPAAQLDPGAPVVPLVGYVVAIFLICWILSWGPYLQPCACSEEKIDLPFLLFAKWVPGVENIRAPGRFAQFYGLPLGILAVVAVRWVTPRLRDAGAVAGVLALVVLLDQMPKGPTYPFVVEHADFFRSAKSATAVAEGEPLIVLPIAGTDHLATWSKRGKQLVGSTVHWARLVTGAGSRETPEQLELIGLDTGLRQGTAALADIAAFARRLGIEKIALFPGDYPPEARERIVAQAEGLDGRVLLRDSDGLLVQLTRR
jgi:hypothetical protein